MIPSDVKRELHKLSQAPARTQKVKKPVQVKETSQPTPHVVKVHVPSARERLEPFLYKSVEEYDSYIGKLSSTWSKEETDYLINLALDLELRWPVIYDQYNFTKRPLEATSTADDEFDDYLPEEDDLADTMGDEQKRTLEDIKARFFSVLRLMSETKTPQTSTRFAYDPVAEAQKVAEAERKYEIQTTKDSTTRLRDLVTRVQEIVNSIDKQEDFPAAHLARPEDVIEGTGVDGGAVDVLVDGTFTNFAEKELKRLQSELITVQHLPSLICKSKGTTTVSALLRASTDALLSAAMNTQRASGEVSKSQKTKSSSVSGGRNSHHHHEMGTVTQPSTKDLVEGVEKSLRAVTKDWDTSALSIDSVDPKKYFATSFAPPIPTQKTLEAHLALKVDAAVFYQLRKQRDQAQALYDTWVNKLLDLRRGLRSSRRHHTSVPATTKSDPRWTSQRR